MINFSLCMEIGELAVDVFLSRKTAAQAFRFQFSTEFSTLFLVKSQISKALFLVSYDKLLNEAHGGILAGHFC